MKKIFLLVSAAALFAACNQTQEKETTNREIQLLTDSAAFVNNNIYTDSLSGVAEEPEPQVSAPVAAPAQRPAGKRPQTAVRPAPQPAPVPQPAPAPAPEPVIVQQPTGTTPSTGNAPVATAPKEEKKGWNKATEGAVIGGAVGAVGGAIISKKKGVGAVVGGVAGAAGGYIIGKNKDKKAKEKSDSIKK